MCEKVRAIRQAGGTTTQICQELDIKSRTTLYNWIEKYPEFSAAFGAQKFDVVKSATSVATLDTLDPYRYNAIDKYLPEEGDLRRELYPKHVEFLNGSSYCNERLFSAANQIGKTTLLLAEGYYHASGNYPEWFTGKRFDGPNIGIFGAHSWEHIRNGIQSKLLTGSDKGDLVRGTGIIPKALLDEAKFVASSVTDVYSEIQIPHKSGGMSKILFLTYKSGRDKWKSITAHWVMLDEEPPLDIYIEASVRVLANDGTIAIGFTPDEGYSETILHFFEDGELQVGVTDDRLVTVVGWDDVPHLTENAKKALIKRIPKHLIKAKTEGLPYAGRGSIFPFGIKELLVDPFEVPEHFKQLFVINPGVSNVHILWAAIDPDSEEIFVTKEFISESLNPQIAIDAVASKFNWMPGIVNNVYEESARRESSRELASLYLDSGLDMVITDKMINAEAGNDLIKVSAYSDKLKIFRTCSNLRNQMQMYHRVENGRIGTTPSGLIDCLKIVMVYGDHRATSLLDYTDSNKEINSFMTYDLGKNKVTGY